MADYDATVAGVRALLQGSPLTATSKPTETEAETWLDEWAADVRRRIGDLTGLDDDTKADVETTARRLVHTATAAQVLDARFPERASTSEDSYAGVLWARYAAGLADLVEFVDVLTPGDPADPSSGGEALESFPEPLFRLGEAY